VPPNSERKSETQPHVAGNVIEVLLQLTQLHVISGRLQRVQPSEHVTSSLPTQHTWPYRFINNSICQRTIAYTSMFLSMRLFIFLQSFHFPSQHVSAPIGHHHVLLFAKTVHYSNINCSYSYVFYCLCFIVTTPLLHSLKFVPRDLDVVFFLDITIITCHVITY
jgi:hypothetical protein